MSKEEKLVDEEIIDEFYFEQENMNPLSALQQLQGVLSKQEELVFMQLLFSSSATMRNNNFGLSRKEVEKNLGIDTDDQVSFSSFLKRVNQAVSRYYRVVYDERRNQVVVLMRVPAKEAKSVLSKEALALLMYMFYHQEVLQNEFTLFTQLLESLGHESLKANQKLKVNLDSLKRIGAIEQYVSTSNEEAYSLTTIGVNMFSDSFLRRYTEFSQTNKLHMEDVLRFFKRYNYEGEDVR